LSGTASTEVSVDYGTLDNTAVSDADYTGVSGTMVWSSGQSGDTTFTVPILEDGVYEGEETFFVHLSNANGLVIGDGEGVVTVVDNDSAPVVSISDVSVDEGAGVATVTLHLSGTASTEVSVDYGTLDNTAVSDADYTGVSGTMVWSSGQSGDTTFTVPILEDGVYEGEETFFVHLSNANGLVIGDGEGVVTVVDNESQPVVSISDVSVDEGAGVATVTLHLSGTASSDVSVDYGTLDNTAVSGEDYTFVSGTMVWSSGQSGDKTFTVPILEDGVYEGEETFFVHLSNANGLVIGDGEGVVTIEDNDSAPVVSISDVSVDEGAGVATVTLHLSGTASSDVSVDYGTLDNTAVSDADYTGVSGTMVWSSGQSGDKTFTVPILEDGVYEGEETFFVHLSNANGLVIGDGEGVVTIEDNDVASMVFGFVWHDADFNAVRSYGENGIPRITVVVTDTLGHVIQIDSTDAEGYYHFNNLKAGVYYVSVNWKDDDMPADFTCTTRNNPLRIVLDWRTNREVNFGFALGDPNLGAIGFYTWHDSNWDRIKNSDEEMVPFVAVRLFRINPPQAEAGFLKKWKSDKPSKGTVEAKAPVAEEEVLVDSVKSNYFGHYLFINLPPGDYMVRASSYGPDPFGVWVITTSDYKLIHLDPGERNFETNFGFAYPWEAISGSIGGVVWNDRNGNGSVDADESGLPGVTLHLKVNNVVQASAISDVYGKYGFEDLLPGDYTVSVEPSTLPPAFVPTCPHGSTLHLFIAAGERFEKADFGYAEQKAWGTERRKLLAQYQPWYGGAISDSSMRYWHPRNRGGVPDTSLMGFYDSNDPLLLRYHILSAWASGIDGFVVDWYGKHSYENTVTKKLLAQADTLWQRFNTAGFEFGIIVSYNEKAIGRLDSNLTYIADSLMTHPGYWGTRHNYRRPLFLYYTENVDTRERIKSFRACADTILPFDTYLVVNGTEYLSNVEACYPWVQPLDKKWDSKGMEWGDSYLDTCYARMNRYSGQLVFGIGGVWPGYDDRFWISGRGNWMDRQDSLVYEKTWEKIHSYRGELSMPWCIVESWNDFNRGTAIEPTVDWNYKFLVVTRDNVRQWKNLASGEWIGTDNYGLITPQHIEQAERAALLRPTEADSISRMVVLAQEFFFQRRYVEALYMADRAAGIEPRPFTIVSVGNSYIELEWTLPRHGNQVRIYYSTDSSRFEPAAFRRPEGVITVGGTTRFTLTELAAKTDYYIAVVPVDTALGLFSNEGWYANDWTGAHVIKVRTSGTNLAMQSASTENAKDLPQAFALYQNYPNPFNPSTQIRYALCKAQHVTLKVIDLLGREVKTLVNAKQEAGYYTIEIDASSLPTGVYFYILQTEEFRAVHKMIVAK